MLDRNLYLFSLDISLMHLSMVCPRMGRVGNPREFDFVKLYQGRDFDIHNGPLARWKI